VTHIESHWQAEYSASCKKYPIKFAKATESKQGGLGSLRILGLLRVFVLGALLAKKEENAFEGSLRIGKTVPRRRVVDR